MAFQQFARFERLTPADNGERFYVLAVQPTLLGDIAFVRTWGRIGSQGKSLTATFPNRPSAQETVERLVRRRLQRRYELVAWS